MNLPPGNTPHRVAVAVAARDGRIRKRVIEIYGAAARDWGQAPGVITRSFRGARELRSVERRFVGEAVYGMIRWRRRVGFAIGSEHATPLALYLVWLAREFAVDGAIDANVESELRVAGIDPARVADVEARLAAVTDEDERLAIAQSYPTWLVARLAAGRGRDDTGKLLAAMNLRAPLIARANRLKNTRE
ncbi:MAG TPA: hypothetical protein VF334_12930, partial [Polyangia bacterium]